MRKNCRFLVAGGGTGAAAIGIMEQLMHGSDNCEVVYVDLSETSMNIARERARIRGFEDKIIWKQGSLLSVAEMDIGTFDYINCSGVLHHLKSPEDGLKALASVLKPDGVMGIMLYAKYGRTAVYQMQEALRLINQSAQNPQQKVDNAITVLNALPESNWFINSPQVLLNEIRGGEAAIYDLLLHSQDRAYSVPEIYDYLATGGLQVIDFFADDFSLGRSLYDPALYIYDEALLKQVQAYPLRDQQAIAELLHGKISKHTIYACLKTPENAELYAPDMVPYFDVSFLSSIYESFAHLVSTSNEIVTLKNTQGGIAKLPKTPHMELLTKYLDGKRTLDEICELALRSAKKTSIAELKQEFALIYMILNHRRWMLLRHKSIPPYLGNEDLQERVNKMYA
jgi:SAM-dependent methyltransferase